MCFISRNGNMQAPLCDNEHIGIEKFLSFIIIAFSAPCQSNMIQSLPSRFSYVSPAVDDEVP